MSKQKYTITELEKMVDTHDILPDGSVVPKAPSPIEHPKIEKLADIVNISNKISKDKYRTCGTLYKTCEAVKENKRLKDALREARISLEAIKLWTKTRPRNPARSRNEKPIWIMAKNGLERVEQALRENKDVNRKRF